MGFLFVWFGFFVCLFFNKSRTEKPISCKEPLKKKTLVFGPTLSFLIKGSLQEPQEKERKN